MEGNVFDEDQFVFIFGGVELQFLKGIASQSIEDLSAHFGHTPGRIHQPLSSEVLPNPFENKPHALFDLFSIHGDLPF